VETSWPDHPPALSATLRAEVSYMGSASVKSNPAPFAEKQKRKDCGTPASFNRAESERWGRAPAG
jgi:hypothetical protein